MIEVTCLKTGKHGHAKANFIGKDVFTQKSYEDSYPTGEKIYVPIVNKIEF